MDGWIGIKGIEDALLTHLLVTPKSDRGQVINIPMEDGDPTSDPVDPYSTTTIIISELDTENAISTCQHASSSPFSGDLICLTCGKVLQANSQLSLDPVYLDRDINKPKRSGSSSCAQLNSSARFKLTHSEREESALRVLARKLIASFALKPAYETEAFELMQRYWMSSESKQKYGLAGNRLLIASIFLLARRDHLAINLGLLADSIDASPQECGGFFDPLIKLDPELRSLARVSDYTERAVDLIISQLYAIHNLKIIEGHLHGLKQKAELIAELLQITENGSSKSAEAVALASTSLALSALLLHDSQSIDLDSSLLPHICEISSVSLKSVKLKRSDLMAKLQERANQLLPSMFSAKMTRKSRQSLILKHLDILL